jgi:hypothetical protein
MYQQSSQMNKIFPIHLQIKTFCYLLYQLLMLNVNVFVFVFVFANADIYTFSRGHRGCNHMVVGFTTT